MNEMEIAVVFVSAFISLMCSGFAVAFSLYAFIEKRATDKSTHVIEYRDPFAVYPDELKMEKSATGKVTIKEDEDMQSEETINDMNKFIKENGVML